MTKVGKVIGILSRADNQNDRSFGYLVPVSEFETLLPGINDKEEDN